MSTGEFNGGATEQWSSRNTVFQVASCYVETGLMSYLVRMQSLP